MNSPSISNSNKNLIVIVGPTAVGKTDVGIGIAKKLGCEILSADSRQIYKELEIGTCKPTEEQLDEVVHHFIHSHSVQQRFTVYDFYRESHLLLSRIFKQNDTAMLVGGSGLYVDTVLNGMDDLPDVDEEIRKDLHKQLEESGIEKLYAKLKELDSTYAVVVDENNPRRILRALEVCIGTGKPFSSFLGKNTGKPTFNVSKIGLELPREELYERINERVDAMITAGLVEEVENLLKYKALPALRTVGYQELIRYFEDEISLDEAIELVKRNTRHYAKRQLTWFKRDPKTTWFHPSATDQIQKHIERSFIERG